MIDTLRRVALGLALMAFFMPASAQSAHKAVVEKTYNEEIAENPDRAAGTAHYYEYFDTPLTKAPKGYKPFYINHYGRHGSRYKEGDGGFIGAKNILDSARAHGQLTADGVLLSLQVDTVWNEHQGMYGMLTERGAAEHRAIARRMFLNNRPVFKGRKEVSCVSSVSQRCIISMSNFTASLIREACRKNVKGLEIHYITGEKYMDYLSHGIKSNKELNDLAGREIKHIYDSLSFPTERFIDAIFKDAEYARKAVSNQENFMRSVFDAGTISPNLEHRPDIFRHFTIQELINCWITDNAGMYSSYGISAECGDYYSQEAIPLIKDFIEKADAAVREDSNRAADLRFGHDTGLLPFVGTIGIASMGPRLHISSVHDHWQTYEMICMASNFQMIFYRNKKSDVIVKLLYNEQETTIPALQTWKGPYYKWADLRQYLLDTISSIHITE